MSACPPCESARLVDDPLDPRDSANLYPRLRQDIGEPFLTLVLGEDHALRDEPSRNGGEADAAKSREYGRERCRDTVLHKVRRCRCKGSSAKGAYLPGGVRKEDKANREACDGRNQEHQRRPLDPDENPPGYTVARRPAEMI